jgi:hypothetical protein
MAKSTTLYSIHSKTAFPFLSSLCTIASSLHWCMLEAILDVIFSIYHHCNNAQCVTVMHIVIAGIPRNLFSRK